MTMASCRSFLRHEPLDQSVMRYAPNRGMIFVASSLQVTLEDLARMGKF